MAIVIRVYGSRLLCGAGSVAPFGVDDWWLCSGLEVPVPICGLPSIDNPPHFCKVGFYETFADSNPSRTFSRLGYRLVSTTHAVSTTISDKVVSIHTAAHILDFHTVGVDPFFATASGDSATVAFIVSRRVPFWGIVLGFFSTPLGYCRNC